MDAIRKHFEALEKSLVADAEAAGILTSPTGRGRAREMIASRFLKDDLPPRIRTLRGEVIDSAGRSSGEADLVLADTGTAAFTIGGETIVPVEAATAVVEVKSSLYGDELPDALRKVVRTKELTRTRHHGFYRPPDQGARVPIPPPHTYGYVVAFDGPQWRNLLKRLENNPEWCRGDYLRYGPEIICILGRGFVFKADNVVFNVPEEAGDAAAILRADLPGLQHIIGHVQQHLHRFGDLTYELTPYYES